MTAPPRDFSAGARQAASILLLRDGAAGLEVMMMRRAERAGDMRSGIAVFPGGTLDASDHAAHGACLGLDDEAASRRLGLPAGGLDYYVAAVREAYEEVGLLLACDDEGRAADAAAWQAWRRRWQEGTAGVPDFHAATGLKLDLRGMVYASHWLTPPGAPQRFDTRFFAVAVQPGRQQADPDLGEAVEAMWLRPEQALEPGRGLKLLPVTRVTLQELARFGSAQAALDAFAARTEIPLIMPRRALTAQGPGVVMPHELPYAEVGRLDPEGRGDVHATLQAGRVVRLSAFVARVTAPNPGPMTGPGTNTYFVGSGGRWTVIDPGPADDAHLQALLAAVQSLGGSVERILVTHTHRDHSPGAVALSRATGAPVWGRRAAHADWQDEGFAPAHEPQHGDTIEVGPGLVLRVVHTPGHASNHLCFLLEAERTLFTGDHVMQGSTVVINPPDGDMAQYLDALRGLLELPLDWLAPGHGFLVARPHDVVKALVAHRLRREAKVLASLRQAGPVLLQALVETVYDDVPARMHGVALRSLHAHLLKLQQDGAARCEQGLWSAAA